MKDFKDDIVKVLKKETKLEDVPLEIPPETKLGDLAFPCFILSKKYKKGPNDIANDLLKKLNFPDSVKEAKVIGPYLNFFMDKKKLAKDTLKEIIKEKDRYGCSGEGKKKKVLVEHTSINPNASPHVGRSRNALIGDCIVRILRFQDYDVETHFYINDVGKQIAMLVLATERKKDVKFEDLLKIYVDINKKLERDRSIEEKSFELLYKLEKGDKDIRKRFKNIVDTCIKGQAKIFKELDISYDCFDYESTYLWDKTTESVLKELDKTGKLFKDDDERWVLDLEGFSLGMKTPVMVLTRNDGTSLYGLRDIAYTIDKVKKGHNIIVLGEDQKLYFDQISSSLKLMGYPYPEVVHYSFVLLKEGKMSTRKGNLVLLEDFMNEAVKKAKTEIKKRHGKVDEKAAKAVAYGAIKYSMLRVSPEKNVIFNWEQALNFEGDTAPYLQYAYARISSILRKSGKLKEDIDSSLLKRDEEIKLIRKLSEFPEIIKKVTKELKPHIIASYLYSLSQNFNEFYHACPVIKAEDKVKDARLVLITCVRQVLGNGLGLLGIRTLEKM